MSDMLDDGSDLWCSFGLGRAMERDGKSSFSLSRVVASEAQIDPVLSASTLFGPQYLSRVHSRE